MNQWSWNVVYRSGDAYSFQMWIQRHKCVKCSVNFCRVRTELKAKFTSSKIKSFNSEPKKSEASIASKECNRSNKGCNCIISSSLIVMNCITNLFSLQSFRAKLIIINSKIRSFLDWSKSFPFTHSVCICCPKQRKSLANIFIGGPRQPTVVSSL